jgi:hypothetical protein
MMTTLSTHLNDGKVFAEVFLGLPKIDFDFGFEVASRYFAGFRRYNWKDQRFLT